MATSDDNIIVRKQSLKNTSTHVHHIKSGYRTTSIAIVVIIERFPTLKEDVIYSKPLLYKKGKINFRKMRGKVLVTLDNLSGCKYGVKCYVKYDSDSMSESVIAKEYKNDTYKATLSSEVINEPENKYLKSGYLSLLLVILSRSDNLITRHVAESRNLKKGELLWNIDEDKAEVDEEMLMEDMAAVFDDRNFSDFRIKVRDYSAPVSKSIIAARSKYFFDYLEEHPDAEEIELDTSPEALKLVLKYMYCGTLYVESEPRVLEVMILARDLKLTKLYDLCRNYIKHEFDESKICANNEKGIFFID